MSHIFVSYVRENQQKVDELCDALYSEGIEVWLDREQLQPGQRWKEVIQEAIKNGAFFICCFSNEFKDRDRSYMNEELTLAIEELRERPIDRSWFIPISFDNGSIPNRRISAVETLLDLEYVDLSGNRFSTSWNQGIRRIISVVRDSTILKEKKASENILASIKQAIRKKEQVELSALLSGIATDIIDIVLGQFKHFDNQTDYILRPLCQIFGNQFTERQIHLMVTRNKKRISRAGFNGLAELYRYHYMHMKHLKLEEVFKDMPIIKLYIRLNGCVDKEEIEKEGFSIDMDYYFDKEINRGDSAFLDSVTIKGKLPDGY